jgi:tetratricopeptide (TPR) repeat protein/DNA-binding CsgD family transcriptional regulator
VTSVLKIFTPFLHFFSDRSRMKYIVQILLVVISLPAFSQGRLDSTYVRELSRHIKEKRYWATYPDSMLYFAGEGMKIAESISDRYGIADMHKFFGIYYWTTGDHASAITHYLKGKQIYDQLGKKFESAQMLSNLGMVYARLGDNEKALHFYQDAIHAMESMPEPDISSMASTISSMGLVFRNHNDLASASAMFLRSLHLYEVAKDSMNIAGTLTNLGTVYSRKHLYDSAILYNKQAEGIFKKLNNPRGLVIAYNNLAAAAHQRNDYPTAIDYLQKAYAINKERGFFDSQIATLIVLGDVKVGQKEYELAEKYFQEAYLLARNRSRAKVIEIYKGLSDANRGMNKLGEALDYYDKFVSLKDSIYSQENAAMISNLRISSELDRKNAEITLLEKDNRIERLYRNVVISVSFGALFFFGALISLMLQKIRKDKRLMQQQVELHEARQAVALNELNIRKNREEELHRELEFRNRALTTYTLNLVQKNGMMDEVRGIVEEVLKKPEQKESELKKLIKLIDFSFTLDKDWDGFKTYFEQVHPDFFKKLKSSFPELSATELKLCALIRLSLSIKESASILSISPDSVKVSRHRIRKKLGLTTDNNLTEFIHAV